MSIHFEPKTVGDDLDRLPREVLEAQAAVYAIVSHYAEPDDTVVEPASPARVPAPLRVRDRVRAWWDRVAPVVDESHPWAAPSRLDRLDGVGTRLAVVDEAGPSFRDRLIHALSWKG